MNKSLFFKYFFPLLIWMLIIIIISISIDFVLHFFQLAWIGRYLGYFGTVLIAISFVYSIRKRELFKSGSPKTFLMLHEYLSLVGAVLILVHAGIHYNGHLAWLATIMLLLNVASGIIGKSILRNAAETIEIKNIELSEKGLSVDEIEKKLFLDSITFEIMQKWRIIHIPISLMFTILSILHIISVFIFTK